MESDKIYIAIPVCTNCGHGSLNNILEIPKGVSVKDYVKEACPNCGCVGYFQKYMGDN